MSVLVNIAPCSLSTTNGFLKAEAYNMSCNHGTVLSLGTSPHVIPFTPVTGSRQNQGVVLSLSPNLRTVNRSLNVSLQEIKGTCTITIASPGVVTYNSHGYSDGQAVSIATTGALPGGLAANTVYYVVNSSTNTFQLSATAGGTAINTTGSQSGTHTLWSVRGMQEQTASEITNATNNVSTIFLYFTWTGYTVTAVASTWRYAVYQTGGTTGNHQLRTSNSTDAFYVEISDIAQTAADNDALVLCAQTTIDQNMTLKGVLGTGDAAQANALIICKSAAQITTSSLNENLICLTPLTSYTLAVDGVLQLGFHSGIRYGTEATPIPYAQKCKLSFPNRTVGTLSGIYNGTSAYAGGAGMSIFAYGEIPTVETFTINADAAVGANTIYSDTDVTAGTLPVEVGDILTIGKQDTFGPGVNTKHTVSAVSWDGEKSTIQVTPNLATAKRMAGAYVVRYKYGMTIEGNTTNRPGLYFRGQTNLKIKGCLIDETFFSFGNGGGAVSTDGVSQYYFGHNSVYSSAGSSQALGNPNISFNGFLIEYVYSCFLAPYAGIPAYTAGVSGQLIVQNCVGINMSYSLMATCNNAIIRNNVFQNGFYILQASGTNATIKDNDFWGSSSLTSTSYSYAINIYTSKLKEFSGNRFNKCGAALGVQGSAFKVIAQDNIFGDEVANARDFVFFPDATGDILLDSPTGLFTPTTDFYTIPNTDPDFILKVKHYNNDTTDYRTYTPRGEYISTKTTPNKLKATSTQSTQTHDTNFRINTGSVVGNSFYLSIDTQIQSIVYYANVHTLPTLELTYDGTTVAADSASATTDSQKLEHFISPTQNYKELLVRLMQKTDATGTDADIIWSNFVLRNGKYGKRAFTIQKDLYETSLEYFMDITDLPTNPYITETVEATVAAYAGISINHITQTITVSTAHTIYDLYDYCQYNWLQNFSYDQFFSTIDGITYTSTYSIVIDSAAVTGEGKILSALTNTITLSNGGSFSGKIIDSTGTRVSITLANIVIGSRYWIAEAANPSNVLATGVSSANPQILSGFLVTESMIITVRVRNNSPGSTRYLPFEVNSNLTTDGAYVYISQVQDPIPS